MSPKIIDDDNGEISAVLDGKEIRSWSYANDDQRTQKMGRAREFVEGWYQAVQHIAAAAALKQAEG